MMRYHFLSLESFGGGSLGMTNKTLMGWTLELGGTLSAISINVIPIDHTSAFKMSWKILESY